MPPKLPSPDRLAGQIDPAIVARARAAVAAGAVTACECEEVGGAVAITGRVQDAAAEGCDVYVRVDAAEIDGDCSCCPDRGCVHVAALLLAAAALRETQAAASTPLSPIPTPTAPPPGPEPEYPPGIEHRLLYLLELTAHETRVRPVTVRLDAEGGYGAAETPFAPSRVHAPFLPAHLLPSDQHLLRALAEGRPAGADEVPVTAALLPAMLATGRCRWRHRGGPLLTSGTPRRASASWTLHADGTQALTLTMPPDPAATAPNHSAAPARATLLPLAPPWYVDVDAGRCGPLLTHLPDALALRLVSQPLVRPEEVAALRDGLAGCDFPLPALITVQTLPPVAPRPRLTLTRIDAQSQREGDEESASCQPQGQPDPARGPRAAPDDAPPESRPLPSGKIPAARLEFIYDRFVIPWESVDTGVIVSTDTVVRLTRDAISERIALTTLAQLGLVPWTELSGADTAAEDGAISAVASDLSDAAARSVREDAHERAALITRAEPLDGWLALQREIPSLRAAGFEVIYADFPLAPLCPQAWRARVRTQADGFELGLSAKLAGAEIELLPLLAAWVREQPAAAAARLASKDDEAPLLLIHDGRILELPFAKIRPVLTQLTELHDAATALRAGRIALPRPRAPDLAAIEAAGFRCEGAEPLRELGERLRDFQGIAPVSPPENFAATLRPYQQAGLDWLQFLRGYQLGGVLADDMGLGKTVQALAHLLREKQGGRMDRPSLVIAPTSLMFNWRNEAARLAPALRLLLLHGADRQRRFAEIARSDLVLTTYPLLTRDFDALAAHDYHLLILDEAQAIKNPRAQASARVRELRARHRLCLTGTPLENHLGELWSVFDFLMPGLLGHEAQFRRLFRVPVEAGDELRRETLARRIRPFFLRRTKERVAPELPEKTEILRTAALDGEQLALYERIREAMRERVREAVQEQGFERSRVTILDALLKLRQVCCDPRLLRDGEGEGVESAKLELLMDMLPEMLEEGRRVLLFSQFTSMLSLIEAALAERGISYAKLTGATRDRAAQVRRFQEGEVPLFLISLKAGGTGLNLTAADTVIHYDPWWNPAVEAQASDRAHRIGQTSKVFVYRLITEGTVEEKILELNARKRDLADALFASAAPRPLTAADLEALFEPLR